MEEPEMCSDEAEAAAESVHGYLETSYIYLWSEDHRLFLIFSNLLDIQIKHLTEYMIRFTFQSQLSHSNSITFP